MSHKIIFEGQSRKQLRFHEVNAILLLLDYFDTDITCISPGFGKTPDIRIKGIEWELKSPQGNGIKTIENILKKATKQSNNIILDFSRIKMNGNQALSRTRYYLHNNKHRIQRLIVITKNHKVIDFKDGL
ncbi:hypothetical protein IKX73_01175 [Candidatus Saccharibacteria bacterium]|nr:hypothetical protein [Candidatus Saccharibacteria bacterium]